MTELSKLNIVVTIVVSFAFAGCGVAFAGKSGTGGPKSNMSSSSNNGKLKTT